MIEIYAFSMEIFDPSQYNVANVEYGRRPDEEV